jgi:hypothetical protein
VENDLGGLVRTPLGLEGQRAFLGRHITLFPLFEQANRDLPAGSRVLLACYCGGFYVDRMTFCSDGVQGSLRMASGDAFADDLRRLHVTHVLAPTTLATGGPFPPFDASGVSFMVRKQEYAVVSKLLLDHGRLLGLAGDEGLYALDWRDEQSSR